MRFYGRHILTTPVKQVAKALSPACSAPQKILLPPTSLLLYIPLLSAYSSFCQALLHALQHNSKIVKRLFSVHFTVHFKLLCVGNAHRNCLGNRDNRISRLPAETVVPALIEPRLTFRKQSVNRIDNFWVAK